MPVLDLNKVVVLGSGALSIGQAGEFDYSGSQALKALEEEGIETILINPNIATVQTNTTSKRKTYLYPVEPRWVEKVFELEKPDAIIAGFGGQTALNCVLKLQEQGILDKYGVKSLGTCIDSLRLTEDRNLFAREMEKAGIPIPPSAAVNSVDDALLVAEKIGYPVIIRAAYALGGLGSGFANNEEELLNIVRTALNFSPQVLIEKSLKGWREIEYEVMRDGAGSVITICNMENIDPLGIHTGDSIVIAPSQTLNDDEFQSLRNYAIKIASVLKIHGECNVQYALSPYSKDFYVIEVNARLSRSSALASKATGYPIAYIAAKLVIGYELIELENPVTGKTRAFFEPAMDYVVVKIPRWDLNKFTGTSRKLGSSMKSVGEVMAIGRNFAESLQKAVRMASENPNGLSEKPFKDATKEELLYEIKHPTDQRMMAVAEAFRKNIPMQVIHDESKIDKWFLRKIEEIINIETEIVSHIRKLFVNAGHDKDVFKLVEKTFVQVDKNTWLRWKKFGFSDHQILVLASNVISGLYKSQIKKAALVVRKERIKKGVLPVVKKIDTSAGEFPADSNYLYVTYEGIANDTKPYSDKDRPVMVLGSGAYRIGSSVEFDWCAVMCSEFLRKSNLKTVVLNCNPETVSTDFNNSDKLYFEELSVERILDIYEYENALGVVTSMGGQIPNNHTDMLAYAGLNILGHSANTIENAESREKFSALLDRVGVEQPRWKAVTTQEELSRFIDKVGFPILVRPSFVLSGTAMKVAYNRDALDDFLSNAALVSPEYPVVATEFLKDHHEIELDGVACDGKILISFMTEHLENAGIHSGDSTLVYPAQKLYVETVRQVKQAGVLIAKELKLNGPFNIQFLAESNRVKVIECNARASRSFPFISKVTGINLAEIAAKVLVKSILNETVTPPYFDEFNLPYVGVKAPMFSFARVEGYDPVLGVEMTSTGEVGCLGNNFYEALLLSLESTGVKVPKKGILVSSGRLHEKVKFLDSIAILAKLNIPIYATIGTAKFLAENNYDVIEVHDAVTAIEQGKVDLVINVPKSLELQELQYGAQIRRAAIRHGLSLITTIEMTVAFSKSLEQYEKFVSDHKPIVLPM